MFLTFIIKNLEDIFVLKLCLYMYAFILISKMKNGIAVKITCFANQISTLIYILKY